MLRDCYSFKELKEKFGWDTNIHDIKAQITYAKKRGVIIEKAFKQGPTYFRIVEKTVVDNDWKVCPFLPYYEVNKSGQIRTTKDKKMVGYKNPVTGYIEIKVPSIILDKKGQKTILAHRLIMKTLNPIQDSENYVVDHINGKRDDNRIENLRWVTQRQNTYYRDENWANISKKLQFLIENKGYEWVNALLEVEIGRIKN